LDSPATRRMKKAPVPYGEIYFNGNTVSYAEIKKYSKYVMQSDCLLPFLTVAETITFSATLRLPHLTRKERKAKAEMIITELGLQTCRDVLVGDHLHKGISGGQKKRVSIA